MRHQGEGLHHWMYSNLVEPLYLLTKSDYTFKLVVAEGELPALLLHVLQNGAHAEEFELIDKVLEILYLLVRIIWCQL